MTENVQITIHLCSFYMLERLYSRLFKPSFSSTWMRTYKCTSWASKNRGTRDWIANIHWVIEKTRAFQKSINFCFSDYTKAFVWITTNSRKILKRREFQITLPVSWETGMWIKKQQLEQDTEQWTGSKLGKECDKAVYCHHDYLTYMQSTAWETLGWRKDKLESRLQGEIGITSDMQMTPPLWQKVKN